MNMGTPGKQPPRAVLYAARLITAVVSLAGAEAVLWLGGYPSWWGMDPQWGVASAEFESDPQLGWHLKEGQFDLVWPGRPSVKRCTNWNGGQRATAENRPSGDALHRPQVAFFGDSFIQGYELSDGETLPWIVQQRHPELQVSNYGVGNYGTYQSYLAMKRWIHGPVSAYYLINEFHEDRNAAAASWLRVNRHPPAGWFYPYAAISDGNLESQRSTGNVVWPLSRHVRLIALVQDYLDMAAAYPRVRNKRQITETLIAKMNEAIQGYGGKFTVILFDLSPQERNQLRQFLQSQQIAFLDCDRPEMRDRSRRLPDGHPNQLLNQLVAGWIEPIALPPSGEQRAQVR